MYPSCFVVLWYSTKKYFGKILIKTIKLLPKAVLQLNILMLLEIKYYPSEYRKEGIQRKNTKRTIHKTLTITKHLAMKMK